MVILPDFSMLEEVVEEPEKRQAELFMEEVRHRGAYPSFRTETQFYKEAKVTYISFVLSDFGHYQVRLVLFEDGSYIERGEVVG